MVSKTHNDELTLLVIGLDGATFDVIWPLIAAGELPNLAALMDKKSGDHWESTIPPFSPPAWASFVMGMKPGRHGIFGFVNLAPLSYDSQGIVA